MVTTRRKSTSTCREASADEASMTWESNKTSGEFDDEQEEIQTPERKRQRTSTGSLKGKGKGKMKARDLMKSFFDVLPLDLIFEIFSHLQPIDLLQLARTNRLLRSHLMQKSSSFVWIVARRNESPPPPECPPDQSEPQWAHLIYTRDCTFCGQPRIQKLYWSLRIRGCELCLKSNLHTRSKAAKTFTEIEDVDAVLNLLPYTNTERGTQGIVSIRKYYLKGSIVKMAVALEDYQTEADSGVKGAKEKLDAFIVRKKDEAAASMGSGREFRKWTKDASLMKKHMDDYLKESRQSAMKAKLLELGHLEVDIVSAQDTATIFDSTVELTEARWKAIRKKAENAVNDAKSKRIERARKKVFKSRKGTMLTAYGYWRQSISVTSAFHGLLPDGRHLESSPILEDVIKQDGDDHIHPDDFIPLFPEVVHHWVRTMKIDLIEKMADGGRPSMSNQPTEAELDRLSLATATFSCRRLKWASSGRQPVFIDDTIRRHPCWPVWSPSRYPLECLDYDKWFNEVATELVRSTGLDPTTATRKDMDVANARYLCGECEGGDAKLARHWRNYMKHLEEHVYGGPTSFMKMNDEDAAKIRLIEDATANTYRCYICLKESVGGEPDAKEHVEDVHEKEFESNDVELLKGCIDDPVSIDTPSIKSEPQIDESDDSLESEAP